MARTVTDSKLDTRTARGRLDARGHPYYRRIDGGLHLGFRKPASGPGKWVMRLYKGHQDYSVEVIATADDVSDSNGADILTFDEAQTKARKIRDQRSRSAAGLSGPYTVNTALDDYLKWLEGEGRSKDALADTGYRANAFIRPKLGDKEIDKLTTEELRNWRNGLAKSQPRIRSKRGEKQRHRDMAGQATEEEFEDDRRARRSSANRIWTTLRAALNHAFNGEKASSDAAWRKVKPFRGVDKARVRYLEVADGLRLANATEAEFRPMVQAGLLTGGRYGQLARLAVSDFNRDAGTVRMSTKKGDGSRKVYHVYLTDEGMRFFKQACIGRNDASGLIFRKSDGSAWQKSDQARPMFEASARAKISPPVNFHCLRHTYASHAVMKDTSLIVVAENLGHSDTRMVEKHYGHLAPSYVADAIRKGAPRFGFKLDRKVAVL
jgi:integrase